MPPLSTPVALTNVRVIDGTGQPARDAQTIVLQHGTILSVGPAAAATVAGAHVLDLEGRTVLPGLVGVHDHLFYHAGSGNNLTLAQDNFAKLYLASGVTTIRTAGAMDFAGDLRLKRRDRRRTAKPGRSIHLTGPYLHAVRQRAGSARITAEVNRLGGSGCHLVQGLQSLRRDELEGGHRGGARAQASR